MEKISDDLLWDTLLAHRGNRLVVAAYGDADDPADVCLEDEDTNEVVLDAELYTIVAREEYREDVEDGPVTPDEITGFLGEILERDTSDLPTELTIALTRAYRLAAEEL